MEWQQWMYSNQIAKSACIEECLRRFEDVLISHDLNLDLNWYRLLPRCPSQDLRDWLNEFVKAAGRDVPWPMLKGSIISRYGVPKEQLRFGRILEFSSCAKADNEPIDTFLERFKRLKTKSGVTDKYVVAMVFFDAFPEATARLIMLAMGQADEASFYDIDHVSAIARRVDLAKRNKVGYSAPATGSSKKRENDRDIPVSPEAKKSKYASLPASPAYEKVKKQEWVSKFGKTLKEHIAERSCKDYNGHFSKGHNCRNMAVRSSSASSGNNNGAKVIRVMTKRPHRRSIKTMVDTAIALEKADLALQEKSKVLSADSSGTADPLVDSDVEVSESDDSSNADETDLRAKAQAALVGGMAQVSVSETDLTLNMPAQQCKFDTVFSAPATMRSNSICVPIVVQNVVCFGLVDTDTTFSCITNEFFNYLGETALSGFRVNPLALRNISATSWKFFWPLSLTYIQRNVIYRFILGCIPHRRLLHRIMPTVFESPLCPVCLSVEDSPSHLLFYCPTKEKIWQGVIFEFFWPTTSVQDIHEALLSLEFSNVWYCQLKGIKPYRIHIITLSQLWLAHMRFIYDKVPIDHTTILASIRNNVRQIIDEDQCYSLL